MNNDARRLPLAGRRAVLIARCAQQRLEAAQEVRELLAPVDKSLSIAGSLKLPLTIAGVVLGMIATRSGRAMPMVTAGLGLWKLVRKVLPILRLLRRPGASGA
jgi:ATP-dependent exoDNAse (exonuclease V) alpha subunit